MSQPELRHGAIGAELTTCRQSDEKFRDTVFKTLRYVSYSRTIELEYTERLCYYVHGVQFENTPLPRLPAQVNTAGPTMPKNARNT